MRGRMFLLKGLIISTLLLAIASGTQPQRASVRGTDTDMAQIQAPVIFPRRQLFQNALIETLQGTGVSGCVVSITRSCEAVAKDFHISKGMQLAQALNALVGTDSKHWWSVETGAVVLIPTGGLPPLLQTKIQEVRIHDKNNLTLAVTELFQAKPVTGAISRLRLEPLPPRLASKS